MFTSCKGCILLQVFIILYVIASFHYILLVTLKIQSIIFLVMCFSVLILQVCTTCCETLQTLSLINLTEHELTILHPGAFVNLKTLIISPQVLYSIGVFISAQHSLYTIGSCQIFLHKPKCLNEASATTVRHS